MKGTILSAASASSQGVIQGDDGVQYTFTPFGWRDSTVAPAPGMAVDFEVRGSHAVGIYPLPGAAPPFAPPAAQPPSQFPSAPQPIPSQQFPTPTPVPQPSGGQERNGHPKGSTPAEQAWWSGALFKTLAAIVLLGAIGAGAYLYFQEARSDEEIALEVAQEWSSSSIDDISELAMGLLVGNAPIVTQVGGDILADKIRDHVAWSFSAASCPVEGQCEVTATANAALDINIPFVFNDTVTVELPFDLDIDTGARRVTDWDADIGAASVRGIEIGDMGEGFQQAMDSSSEEVRRAVLRLQEIAEDEDVQRAVSDAADTFRSFAEDEDVQRAVSDTADTIRSFAEDEDVEHTIRETSDAVQSGIKSLFGD